jgi:hypothetical protein
MRTIATVTLAGLMLAGGSYQATAAEPVNRSGITYVSGGIGVDAEEKLRAQRSEYNLMLVFTLTEGNYIADVRVTLADAKGATLVEHVADGPYFLAKLPAGRYSVSATYEGKTQTRTVSVGGKGLSTAYLRWPSNPATDFVIAGGR